MPPRGKASPVAKACIFLIIVGVTLYSIILHHYITLSMAYSKLSTGTCITVKSSTSAEMKKCDCGKRCESYFRCLYIIVVLVKRPPPEDSPLANGEIEMSHPNYPEKSFTVPLYDTTSEAISSRNCSYFPGCKKDWEINDEKVTAYKDKYSSPGTTFMCYYLPHDTSKVIRSKVEESNHFLIWPPIILALLLAVLIYIIKCSSYREDNVFTIIGLGNYCPPITAATDSESATANERETFTRNPSLNQLNQEFQVDQTNQYNNEHEVSNQDAGTRCLALQNNGPTSEDPPPTYAEAIRMDKRLKYS